MDSRTLTVLAILVGGVAAWFYYGSGRPVSGNARFNNGMDYSARDLHILQTDEQGHLVMRAGAQGLQHFSSHDRIEITAPNSVWYQPGKPDTRFSADHAISVDDYAVVTLTGHVTVIQVPGSTASGLTFDTEQLTGYPDKNIIQTAQPVKVQGLQGNFLAKHGLNANLAQGVYRFNDIQARYLPSTSP